MPLHRRNGLRCWRSLKKFRWLVNVSNVRRCCFLIPHLHRRLHLLLLLWLLLLLLTPGTRQGCPNIAGPSTPPRAPPSSWSASPAWSLVQLWSCRPSPDHWSAIARLPLVSASARHRSRSCRPSPGHQLITAWPPAVAGAAHTTSPARCSAARSSSPACLSTASCDSRSPSLSRSASAIKSSSDWRSHAPLFFQSVSSGRCRSGTSSVSSSTLVHKDALSPLDFVSSTSDTFPVCTFDHWRSPVEASSRADSHSVPVLLYVSCVSLPLSPSLTSAIPPCRVLQNCFRKRLLRWL